MYMRTSFFFLALVAHIVMPDIVVVRVAAAQVEEEEEKTDDGSMMTMMTMMDCEMQCSTGGYENSTTLWDLCVTSCTQSPDLFDVQYPYLIGPLTVQPYPDLTNVDPDEVKNFTGTLWARVNQDRNKMQFYYKMDSDPEPFYPYFA